MSDVVVYGGASGIGQAVAYQLAAVHENVFVYDIKEGDLEGVTYRRQMFGSDDDLAPAREEWRQVYVTLGRPSIRLFDKLDIEYEYELMRANFHAVTQALRHARGSASNRCAYIVTSSVSAERADPGGAVYAAAKAGLEALVRGLAREWQPATVNAIAPGPTGTAQFMDNVKGIQLVRERERSPVGKIVQPGNVASLMVSVARNEAITGQALTIDHGGTVASRR